MLTTRLFLIVLALALTGASPSAETARLAEARLQADVDVVRAFRPAYPFWQHIFTIPDGRIAFGSARDGRLLATFPSKGDWSTGAVWLQPDLGTPLSGVKWPLQLGRPPRPGRRAPGAEPRAARSTTPRADCSCCRTSRATARSSASGASSTSASACRPTSAWPRLCSSRAQRHRPVQGQRARAVPVAAAQLAGAGPPVAGHHRGLQPDHAGVLLRGVSLHPGDDVRQLHPGAVGAPQRRCERRARASSTASGWAARRLRSSISRARSSRTTCGPWISALSRSLPDLRRPLVPLRRDGVRQHRQRRAHPIRGPAGSASTRCGLARPSRWARSPSARS